MDKTNKLTVADILKNKDKKKLRYRTKPTANQKKVFGLVLESVRKSEKVSVSKAMRESGVYAKSMLAHPEKITNSIGWLQLLEEYLPDSLLQKKHRDLLDSKIIQKQVFNPKIPDDVIIESMAEAGLKIINMKDTPIGKLVIYSTDNTKAIQHGLDMAYQLKGKYAPDKHVNLNVDVETDNSSVDAKIKRINDILGIKD